MSDQEIRDSFRHGEQHRRDKWEIRIWMFVSFVMFSIATFEAIALMEGWFRR